MKKPAIGPTDRKPVLIDNANDNNSQSSQTLPRNVKLLGVASLLNDVASEIIYPLMPQFLITVLGGNRFHLGIIEGVAESISSVLKLGAGGWSDKVGQRKGFVIIGYALAAVSRPLIGVVTAPWQLFAARTADRIGKGLRTSPRDALIADSTDAEVRGRAFGFHRAMDHLGAAIGPILASVFLLAWPGQLRLLFLLTLVPGLAVVALLAFGLREKPLRTPPEERPRLTLKPFDRNFRLYLLALVVFTLGNSSDAFLLVRAGELGVPTALLPLLWCAFHVVKSGGNLLAGHAVDKIGCTTADPHGMDGLRRRLHRLWFDRCGVASVGCVSCVRPVLRTDRTCGENAGCILGGGRTEGAGVRLV